MPLKAFSLKPCMKVRLILNESNDSCCLLSWHNISARKKPCEFQKPKISDGFVGSDAAVDDMAG